VNIWVKQLVKPFIDRLVYASAGYEELKSALVSSSRSLIDFSRSPSTNLDVRIKEIASLVKPYQCSDSKEIRIGGPNDGGYVMQQFDAKSIGGAMSIGVGPDVSWDQAVSQAGIFVHMFDPTVSKLPAKVANGLFHKIGIGPVTSSDPKFLPLDKLRQISNFSESENLLLKIDVEGAEWSSLRGLPAGELERYSQIVIEMHDFSQIDDDAFHATVVDVLNALHKTHIPIHLHANNYAPLLNYGSYWFPEAIEVSYVRRENQNSWGFKTSIHSEFDRPNCPTMTDFNLDGLLHA
jgi:hypothetical protein